MESREERYKGEESSVEVSGREMVVALGDGSREGGGKDDPKNSSSSLMLGLLDEFTKIYSDRLQRVEETAMKCDQQQYWENKVRVLESWVRDLGEQNAVLVVTVEELEREAADRVALLEDRLAKMATTTRESCVSLRDHQIQVSSLVTDKIGLEKKAQSLGEKMLALERRNVCLKEENNNLQSDLTNLVQVITRARQTGQWEADDLTFSCVTPEQVFGTVLSSSRRSSQSLKESQHDYIHQIFEDRLRKDNSSLASSFSNLQDADSAYGGRGSEKDLLIMKLKADLRSLQATHEETNRQLLERDKHIADLQTQLTDTHHELALSQAEVNSVNHTLQEARHRSRHENVEITRKEEVIRHLLSKQSVFKKDSTNMSVKSLCDLDNVITGENNVEAQLGKNIDVLVSRLAELEEECQQVRDQHAALQNTHALCTPTINMLREQLNRSHQTQVELRTVLTAEVAQRHDQLVALRDELKEQEQKHHETQMQLQLKTEVIKDLRKEVRDMKERQYIVDDKNALTSLKEGVYSGTKETKSSETQTQQVFSSKNESLAEETSRSPNGFYSTSQPSQISKLENELELKLDSSRREGCQKGERMQYLTGQLTSLQLEVGRTHGQAEQLRRQVEKKTELIEKMESENSSLTHQLNEKSATLERFQTELLKTSTDLERKRKEVSEQKMMIRTLQEALVASKRSCDELRSRLDSDVSRGMLHHSLPLQMCDSSNNPLASNPSVTKSIPVESSIPPSASELTSACVNDTSSNVNFHFPPTPVSDDSCMLGIQHIGNSVSHSRTWQHSALPPVDRCNCDSENRLPDSKSSYKCANKVVIENTSCAITPDVLSSCSGNYLIMNSTSRQDSQVSCSISSEVSKTISGQSSCSTINVANSVVGVEGFSNHAQTGQVYDV